MHCSLPGWNFGFLGVVEKQRQPIQVRRGWPGHLIVFSQGMQVLARGQVLFLNRKGCTSHSLLLLLFLLFVLIMCLVHGSGSLHVCHRHGEHAQ